MPFGVARYGAVISGFTNGPTCVLSVDKTNFFTLGDLVRVANVVSSGGDQINTEGLIISLTPTTIEINVNSSTFGSYISGGFVSVVKQANAVLTPFLQSNFLQPFIPYVVFNQSQGSSIQSTF